MARVLMISLPEKGHFNPLVGVAQWLRRADHHVGWLCIPEPSPQLAKLDVETVRLSGLRAPEGEARVTNGEALAKLVRDRPAMRKWLRMMLLEGVDELVEPLRQALRAFRPQAIALDGMIYPAVIAAELERVPYAGVSSALTLLEPTDFANRHLENVRTFAADRDALFARYGLKQSFRTCEALSPRLNTIFATEALVGAAAPVPPATYLVGPSVPLEDRGDAPVSSLAGRLDGKPIVYASFGSQLSWQPELFTVIAEAAAPLDVRLVLSAGELAGSEVIARLPGDVLALSYVPQLEVLERAAAFVSHGGANSVMEAMTAGVPMLLLPMCNDQPLQAYYLQKSGAGLAFDPDGLTVERCRDALARLLAAGNPYRATAERIRDSYRSRNGAREAAERIAALAA